jgi:oligopeptide/dipeptide ABC transporter ATP-binding protein
VIAAETHAGSRDAGEGASEELLAIRDLSATAETNQGTTYPLQGVTFSVPRKRIVGLVGESGSGKSLTTSAVLGLLPAGVRVTAGEILFDGRDLVRMSERRLRRVRGAEISIVFQNPRASLNPVMPVGKQIAEVLRIHEGLRRRDAWEHAVELLAGMGIRHARQRARDYPHQYSGGMAQRAALARALACGPKLLIADEPTTGLDATVQQDVLELLVTRIREQGASLLLISHDIGVIAATCDEAVVMYAGMVLEAGDAAAVLERPLSPYTEALVDCFDVAGPGRMRAIPGTAPLLTRAHRGCPFAPRCPLVQPGFADSVPTLREREGRMVACHLR